MIMVRMFSTCGMWLLLGSIVIGQTAQRSSIVGHVTDSSGAPVAGATVTLSGPSLLRGPLTTQTNTGGEYRFMLLLPGTYALVTRVTGFVPSARDAVELPVETARTVDLVLHVEPMSERIDVVARLPMLDVTTASAPALFTSDLLQNLPVGRSLGDILNLAPGVTGNVAFGGTEGANGLSIDRVSLVESRLGAEWVPVSHNWLQAVQVVALGAAAEYGQTTGAIANGVIRSGSDRFSGLFDYVAAVPEWTGSNTGSLPAQLQERFAARDLRSWRDVNGQVGGPLRRQRLWFFAGGGTIHEAFRPFGYDGPETSERREPRGILKVDATPSGSIALQGFYLRDVSTLVGEQLGAFTPNLETAGIRRRRNHVSNVRATWTLAESTRIEAQANGVAGHFNLDPHAPASADGPPPQIDVAAGVVAGNILNWIEDTRRATSAQVRLGHDGRMFGRSHDFVAGFEHEAATAMSGYGPPAGRRDILSNGVLSYIELDAGYVNQTRTRRTTVYLQDRLALANRITVEPGLRIERYVGGVPADPEVLVTTPVALRLGLALDLTRTHTTVIRGHYGRFHDMPFAHIYSFQDVSGVSPRIQAVPGEGGVFQEISRDVDTPPAYPISRRLKQSHVDQWSGGIEHHLLADVVVEGRYVLRRFGNFIGYIDRRLDEWRSFGTQDPGPDGIVGTDDDGGAGTAYVPYWHPGGDRDLIVANPEGAYRRYDGVQVLGRKRFSRDWEGQASYTWSRSVGTIGNGIGTNATQGALSFLGYGGDRVTNARPPSRPVFDYSELKLLGFYRSPALRGVAVGGIYRWHTGSRWHRRYMATDPLTRYQDFVDAEEPFSRRMPAVHLLDLRVEKQLRLGPHRVAGLYLDALNATNAGRPLGYFAMSGPRFQQPTSWTTPRTIRLGVRYAF